MKREVSHVRLFVVQARFHLVLTFTNSAKYRCKLASKTRDLVQGCIYYSIKPLIIENENNLNMVSLSVSEVFRLGTENVNK